MKILLIDPPFYRFIKYYNRFFPLGLAYLAAVLRDKGHEVLVYDADANVEEADEMDFSVLENKYHEYIRNVNDLSHPIWNELRDVLNEVEPDLVGVSVFTTKIAAAFRIAEVVKSLNPDTPVVVGGPHPSVCPEESLMLSPFVDFAVRGEGEVSFPQLVEAIESGKPYENIKGVSFKAKGCIHHNGPAEFVRELDRIPYPARDLLINKSSYTSEDMGLVMTGRGCPFECTFCSSSGVWHRVVRFRSIENIIDEMRQIQAGYGTVQFSFKDDTFTINRRMVLEFCRSVRDKRFKASWDCNARVNLIDEPLLMEMKASGCNGIKMGIESGSDRILREVMKKGITIAQIESAARIMRKVGIHWTGYFMMGLPTETKEEMLQTLGLLRRIKPDFASLSVYEPFPGTQLYESGVTAGYVADALTLEDYYSKSPKYYYMKDLKNRIDTMSDEEFRRIEKAMKSSFHRYNSSPVRICKRARARSALYVREPAALLGDFKKFLAWLT